MNNKQFLHDILGITLFTDENNLFCADMEVTEKVCQPFGFLSGGATLALAETLAGYASLSLCEENTFPVGIQVSANHLNSAPLGVHVRGIARLLKKSNTFHVWEINVFEFEKTMGKIISTCQITNYVKGK